MYNTVCTSSSAMFTLRLLRCLLCRRLLGFRRLRFLRCGYFRFPRFGCGFLGGRLQFLGCWLPRWRLCLLRALLHDLLGGGFLGRLCLLRDSCFRLLRDRGLLRSSLRLLAETEATGGAGALRLLQITVSDAGSQRHLQLSVDDALVFADAIVADNVFENRLTRRPASLLQCTDARGDHHSVLGVRGDHLRLGCLLGDFRGS